MAGSQVITEGMAGSLAWDFVCRLESDGDLGLVPFDDEMGQALGEEVGGGVTLNPPPVGIGAVRWPLFVPLSVYGSPKSFQAPSGEFGLCVCHID